MINKFEGIEVMLAEGAKLHAFRSGAALRVFRIEKDGQLLAYGEHPYAEESLRILEDDARAGGRDYREVYGKIEDHYLSGAYVDENSSALDRTIANGYPFGAERDGEEYVVWRTFGIFDEPAPRVDEGRGVTLEAALADFEANAPTAKEDAIAKVARMNAFITRQAAERAAKRP